MKPLYILKIGGSVATYKNRPGFSVRRTLLKKIARSIKIAKEKEGFDLILIHGAGSTGHQIAHEYGLAGGVAGSEKKLAASLRLRIANQKLNGEILGALVDGGLPAVSVHTASVIIQKDKKIEKCNLDVIKEALKQNCIPLLYGEMVFDEDLKMTVCSGDIIAPYLSKKMQARKIFFASDINGIYDKDPYLHKNARLIENLDLAEIFKNNKIKISESHNIDVTGGLLGKIRNLDFKQGTSLQCVEIFNGLKEENYSYILLGNEFPHSKLLI